jgi:hypothetical protein
MRLAASTVAVAALTAASLYRQSGVPSWRTLWAEDGVFIADAQFHGIVSLAYRYNGYLVIPGKVIAILVNVFLPVRLWSEGFAFAGALVTALLAIAAFCWSDFAIKSRLLRAVLASAIVLHPLALHEVLNSGVNIIWPLSFVCFLAVVRPPRTKLDTAFQAFVVLAATLAQVLVIFYAPLVVLAVWQRRRDVRTRIIAAAFIVGFVVQGIATIAATGTGSIPGSGTDWLGLPGLYALRVVGTSLVGDRWLGDLWSDHRGLTTVILLVAFLLLVVPLTFRAGSWARRFALLAASESILIFVVAIGVRGTGVVIPSGAHLGFNASRDVYLSLLLLLVAVFTLFDRADLAVPWHVIVVLLVAVQFAVVVSSAYRWTNLRSGGPNWPPVVSGVRAACIGPPKRVGQITLPISPPPVWGTSSTCSRIVAGK